MADGKLLKLSGERFEAAEILFRPELIQREQKGVSEMVFQVIQNADIDLRPQLYEKIILSGGTSMMLGFAERLQSDLEAMYAKLVGSKSKKV
jgi:actin-related protein 2